MLYYKNFSNYEDFKNVFGMVAHGNGVKSRKNKIRLSLMKQKEILHHAVTTGDEYLLKLDSIVAMKNVVMARITASGNTTPGLHYTVRLMDYTFHSGTYATDDYKGICEDGDYRAIRYINHDRGNNIYKMKAGKFIRALIQETDFGKMLPEQVLIYLQEEFVGEWQNYASDKVPTHTLHVNTDFRRIYDSDEYDGEDFHSCMTDKGYHTFYSDAVDAEAAFLENEDGYIIARCIIYTHVYDQDGKRYRLAERQYAAGGSDVLKRALVDALIKEDYIDGYKTVGAACSDAREFVANDGTSLANKRFKIECRLDTDDPLSYQDSFKWYNSNREEAYNYDDVSYDYELDTTNGYIEDDSEWDSWHDRSCASTVEVHASGQTYMCDENDLDDFVYIGRYDAYYHRGDVTKCAQCGEYVLDDDAEYSDLTEKYYCDTECMAEAEDDWKKDNWEYSDFDNEYFDPEDIETLNQWDKDDEAYIQKSIHIGTLMGLLREKKVYEYNGEFYNLLRHGEPYLVAA